MDAHLMDVKGEAWEELLWKLRSTLQLLISKARVHPTL